MSLAITMGDANGVGPEILLRCHVEGILPEDAIVYGEVVALERGSDLLGLARQVHRMRDPSDIVPGTLNVASMDMLTADEFKPGKLSAKAGLAAFHAIRKAVHDVLAGHADAIVTLPMNKEATALSVPDFTGHTSLIANLCNVSDFSMMLATKEVAVNHVSAHVSLQEAIRSLDSRRVLQSITLLHDVLCRIKTKPRLAVCGLNPHAGENGLFGDEESRFIAPAIQTAVSKGLHVTGPCPADTVFRQAIHQDRFDGIVCMYHDQGHAPIKLWAFETTVNVTLGLPIVRTSVDHGTAFDIAWKGQASTKSLPAAISYAEMLIEAGYPSR